MELISYDHQDWASLCCTNQRPLYQCNLVTSAIYIFPNVLSVALLLILKWNLENYPKSLMLWEPDYKAFTHPDEHLLQWVVQLKTTGFAWSPCFQAVPEPAAVHSSTFSAFLPPSPKFSSRRKNGTSCGSAQLLLSWSSPGSMLWPLILFFLSPVAEWGGGANSSEFWTYWKQELRADPATTSQGTHGVHHIRRTLRPRWHPWSQERVSATLPLAVGHKHNDLSSLCMGHTPEAGIAAAPLSPWSWICPHRQGTMHLFSWRLYWPKLKY